MYQCNKFNLKVMTSNLYAGSSPFPLILATEDTLPEAVTEVYNNVLATYFPFRAKALAKLMKEDPPDVIGLQEADIWKFTPPNSSQVVIDYVDILIKELREVGLFYKAVVSTNEFGDEYLSSTGAVVSLRDRDVILVNQCSGIKIVSTQSENFKNIFYVTIAGKKLPFTRGYCSFDGIYLGRKFRFINTQLEVASQETNLLQAQELVKGPAMTTLPLFLTGDFNSNADLSNPTYKYMTESGFIDSFAIAGEGNGFTCCEDPTLLNVESILDSRIDWVLFKNFLGLCVEYSIAGGHNPQDKDINAHWFSDHAFVISKFESLR